MNQLNYATLEASKRLHNAGIVLETDAHWRRISNYPLDKWGLVGDWRSSGVLEVIPAPSMTEVWRELPENSMVHKITKTMYQAYILNDYGQAMMAFMHSNPTDALIDLLISIKGIDAPK